MSRSAGQALVIVAIGFAVLCGAAALAFDIGAYLTEVSYLQNAANAAALAGAQAIVEQASVTTATSEAVSVATSVLAANDDGAIRTPIPSTPQYAPGHTGDVHYLINGVVITSSEVRVALQSTVPFTFARLVGLGSETASAHADAQWLQDYAIYPFVVKRFQHPPGPNNNVTQPCPLNTSGEFVDQTATADTNCLGTLTDGSLRNAASEGAPFNATNINNDTAHHGIEIAIAGVGAEADDTPQFRGWVALDIRNFTAFDSNVYYNGVQVGVNPDSIKNLEAGYELSGYPGPPFSPVTGWPVGNNEIATLDGTSAGNFLSNLSQVFTPGQEIFVPVYNGTTETIPDFSVSTPPVISFPTTGAQVGPASILLTANQQFTGTVNLSTLADPGDPNNPITAGQMTTPFVYTPNGFEPTTRGSSVTMTGASVTNATPGLYSFWIYAHSGSPWGLTRWGLAQMQVGSVTRYFAPYVSGGGEINTGGTATFTVSVKSANPKGSTGSDTHFGGTVYLSVEGMPTSTGQAGGLPSGIGAIALSPTSMTFDSVTDTTLTSTMTVNAGSLPAGNYSLVLRATGTNADGQEVTKLVPFTLQVATGSSGTSYVEIGGYVIMRVTRISNNTLYGYAVSPVVADPNDPALRTARAPHLVPWW